MTDHITKNELKNTQLIAIFDEMLRKRPDLLEEIPGRAVVIMQIKGDKEFNVWARRITEDEARDRPRFFIEFAFKTPVKPTSKRPLSWEQVDELKLQAA